MTRRFKVVAIIITIITLSVSTYCGVLASQKLSGLSLGTIRNYSSLDALDGNVGMVNVLLIGVDDGGYRSDTIMLASLDGYSNRVSILSIPRDTMVTINGTTQKINATMGIV
ncbi:MAG: LCP family protein, partial [Monoglobus pectinilyticus]